MTLDFPLVGAFAFGAVLGWLTYFTNRYRTGEVQFADLATLLGVIGGAAATSLFGDAKQALFGAYGLGLAAGFFLYFLLLLTFVGRAKHAFDITYFIDGRRKIGTGYEWPAGARIPPVAMDFAGFGAPRPQRTPQFVPMMQAAQEHPVAAEAARLRDRAITSGVAARLRLAERIMNEPSAATRQQLFARSAELDRVIDDLRAARLREINDSAADAVARLRGVTKDLETEAEKMKAAADALAQVAAVIDRLTSVLSLFIAL